MIPSRQRALDELWLDYGITDPGPLDPDGLFGRPAPCYMEIGFGMGDVLLKAARTHPENNYLGVEVYLPGVGQLLLSVRESGITNVRVDRRDIMEVLALLPAKSLAGASLFFPDPWPKQRHQKRRLVQAPFAESLHRVLAPGGHFLVATDRDDYAMQIRRVMEAGGAFTIRSGPAGYYPGAGERPPTRFERRCLRQGRRVSELVYERI